MKLNKLYTEFSVHSPEMSYFEANFKVLEDYTPSGLEVFFQPNTHCSEDEKKKLLIAKTAAAQQTIYDALKYKQTISHEGCRFGLDYAYKKFQEQRGNQPDIAINITITSPDQGNYHQNAAYVCCKALWDILGFTPKEEVYYSEPRRRFIFPGIDWFPIGYRTINEIPKLFTPIQILVIGEEVKKDIERYEKEYFSR